MLTNGGFLISVEGLDGAGKSSGVPVLQEAPQANGYSVLVTHEPGGGPVGEHNRELILHHDMSLQTELLLIAAARAEHVEQVIYPRWGVENPVGLNERPCFFHGASS
ncbi:dTMP kinase [Pandoraea pnomenusa]|uniref:dTMP kinase n=1 Tax=Pandoraea pnomenusa TaxID=93220 RepID=UPI00333EC7EA